MPPHDGTIMQSTPLERDNAIKKMSQMSPVFNQNSTQESQHAMTLDLRDPNLGTGSL